MDQSRANDLSLQAITQAQGFKHFAVDRLPGRLRRGETRYFVPDDPLPAALQRGEQGAGERMCGHAETT